MSNKYYQKYREQNKERLLAYDKWRNHNVPKRIQYRHNYAREYYLKNKEKIIKRTRKWKQMHKEQNTEYIQAWRDTLFEIWGTTSNITKEKIEVAKKAEHLTRQILLNEEFYSVLKMRPNFPFDFLAKKDNKTYAVEVTTYPRRKIPKQLILLLSYLNLKYIIVFVRPTLRDYYMVEIDYLKHKTKQVPIEVVLKGGKRI